ncbi:MAG: hypothetical protein Q8Q87_01880 [Candidatus Omnitrophota bacterium]|nr:hypothetical protein [Candidatus Omnitrophota bacterium]
MKKRPLDIEGLIVQVQQQLTYLDKKIDTLISQTSAKPFEVRERPQPFGRSQPFRRFDQPGRQGEVRQTNNYMERVLHKTICANCRKECEVPFKPSGGRPVYCKECFAKRKAAGSSFQANIDSRPREGERIRERPSYKHASVENRRPYEKKKFPMKRKKRP